MDATGAPLDGFVLYDPDDPFEMHAGPFFWRAREDGSHHFVFRAETRHCNRQGNLHGGILMTMIDLTLAATAKEVVEDRVVTISLNSEFVSGGKVGEIIESTAELVRKTRSLAFVRGEIRVADRVLLTASAVFKRMTARPAEPDAKS